MTITPNPSPNPAPPAAPPAGPGSGSPPVLSSPPEGLPAQFWDQQTGQVNLPEFVKSYGEVSAFKTQHDQRIAALPKDPKDYKIELKLPDGVKVPDGAEFKIDDKDPRLPAVRAFAHKHQLSQDTVNELISLHAQMEIEAYAAGEAELQAEMKKLGSNGPARTQAAETFLKANLGKDEYEALRPVIGNAVAFAAVEKLIARATSQSVPANLNGGTPPNPPQAKKRPADVFYGSERQQKAS